MITAEQAGTFSRCMTVGGVAVFGADTVYGLACEPGNKEAVRRLYALKHRAPVKPAAIMFFDVRLALAALPEQGPRTRLAMEGLLPGGVTLLLPNPAQRFPLACRGQPDTLGVRVPALTDASIALTAVRWPILQTSANLSGEAEARTVEAVPTSIRDAVDLVLDAGPLPGTSSTVIDLRRYESESAWTVIREGAVGRDAVAAVLG